MRHKLLVSALVFASTIPALAAPRARRGPTSPHIFSKRATKAPAKATSQRGIDPERATQIQAALIKQGYMIGEPSGKWDANTEAALEKLQGDNGWQTKLVPDSRAIIKLGLGPGSSPEVASYPASSTPEKLAPLPFSGEAEASTPAQQ
ncbi:Putative peptidoglycan binding domain-containing protein [Granulicella pectinivorans]|uniref:Putative peptidoglycan binding domain-containing protein n=1 Tax=Granulicella pectinivorans TaxID=474950 RepID=A0A1I6MJS1_9BACT|nr:peptidoglycan-binding domain-containing protein [Granulicella pectinivorans]SFS15935.1 Putative peptidoglycan binding domain-containing protein [Granulicella pectinivorans]